MTQEGPPPASGNLVLVARRTIKAGAARLFDAWTQPEQLMAWWGPRPVRCSDASVDLRLGGRYRIENELPDGGRLSIEGEFTLIERSSKLIYTWNVRPGDGAPELVTVRFDAKGPSLTEVIVLHERIASPVARESHEAGWSGCLAGLALYLSAWDAAADTE
jgi:uncharacterized protein YndB with AHSA1/START domain